MLLLERGRPGVSNAAGSLNGRRKVCVALGALGACVRVGAFSQDQLSIERKEFTVDKEVSDHCQQKLDFS